MACTQIVTVMKAGEDNDDADDDHDDDDDHHDDNDSDGGDDAIPWLETSSLCQVGTEKHCPGRACP